MRQPAKKQKERPGFAGTLSNSASENCVKQGRAPELAPFLVPRPARYFRRP
jgi:hypothetical protein